MNKNQNANISYTSLGNMPSDSPVAVNTDLDLLNQFKQAHSPGEFLPLLNPKRVYNRNGIEIRAGCSLCEKCRSGYPLQFSPSKKVWLCRKRHNKGGSSIDALALSKGIILCHDLGHSYTKAQWSAIFSAIRDVMNEDKR